jgi:hypothetical protein
MSSEIQQFIWFQNGQIFRAEYHERLQILSIYDKDNKQLMLRKGVSKKQFDIIRELKEQKKKEMKI